MGVTIGGSGRSAWPARCFASGPARWAAVVACAALVVAACETVPPTATPGGTAPPTPGASAAVLASVEITPGAVLLTAAGQTQTLTAAANAADGSTMTASVTWSSSDPAVASVDASGTVTAEVAFGSATITATAGGITSPPAFVTIGQPVPGAILLEDEQIVSGPTAVEPAAEPASENPYEVVLRGVEGVATGAILINTGGKSVGGRVVSTTPDGTDTRVRLVVVPPGELFTAVEFSDTVDLGTGPYEIPPDLAAAYGVVQTGSTFTFTPKTGAAAPGTPTAGYATLASVVDRTPPRGLPLPGVAQGTRALPPLPPFSECEAELGFGSGLPVPLSLSAPPSFTFTAAGTADRQITAAGTTIAVSATPTFEFQAALEVKAAFEAKVECKATLVTRNFRVPGWAGLFFGGDVNFGVGFEVGGEVTLTSAKVGGKAELKPVLTATLTCPTDGDCDMTGSSSAETDAEPVLEAPSLNQARFEPTVNLFGFIDLEAGNADVDALQFEAIEAKAGVELGASLALEGLQIDNTDAEEGRSKYELAFKGEVGPGVKLGEFLEYLGLDTVELLKLEFEAPLGESPTGTVKADRPRYLPGDSGTVTVTFEADSTVFPSSIGTYNVNRVVVARRNGLTTEVLGSADASDGQTTFDVPITATSLVDADELYAFVVTKLLPLDPPKLEIGGASWSCDVAGPLTIDSIDDDPDKIYVMFDGGSECRLIAEVGDSGFQGDGSDMILSIDTDPGESGWDGEPEDGDDDGANWESVGGFAQNIGSGTHTFRSRRVDTGTIYRTTVTVQVQSLGGGDTRMTVSEVSIRLAD